MLQKENRLNLSKDFKKFKEHGQVIETPHFRLVYLPASKTRFGFVITNRVGKATKRNHAKRLLSEVVQLRLNGLPPMEAVFIGRNKLMEAKFEEVIASFDKALSKINLPR